MTLVNAETVINSNAREYNPYEWTKTVKRYQQYENVIFFKVENETRYSRDEFIVEYTINGLCHVQLVSYGACLHNGGFYRVLRTMCDANFTDLMDVFNETGTLENYKMDQTKFLMSIMEFQTSNGKTGPADNCDANRKIFIQSKQTVTRETFGLILK